MDYDWSLEVLGIVRQLHHRSEQQLAHKILQSLSSKSMQWVTLLLRYPNKV